MMAHNSLTAYRTARSAFCALEPNLLPSSRKSGEIASICGNCVTHTTHFISVSQHGDTLQRGPARHWVACVHGVVVETGMGHPCLHRVDDPSRRVLSQRGPGPTDRASPTRDSMDGSHRVVCMKGRAVAEVLPVQAGRPIRRLSAVSAKGTLFTRTPGAG